MAATDSTYYTNQVGAAGSTRHKTTPRAQNYRTLRIRKDLDAGEVATDTFNLFRLKVGQTLIPGLSYVTTDDAGTTLTIDIGDSVDADGYANGMDLASATVRKVNFCDPAIPAYEDAPHVATAATEDVVVTIATSGTPAAASVVFYLTIIDEYAEQS